MKYRLTILLLVLASILCTTAHAAAIKIVRPQPEEEISGKVIVEIAIEVGSEENLTAPLVQGVNGQRWSIARSATGRMIGEVDTTQLPNGRQTLMVAMTPIGKAEWREGYDDSAWAADKFITMAEVPVIVRNAYQYYWGDLHAHTSYSDGAWFPAEAYKFAREVAQIDFFAITDHLEIITMDEFSDIVASAQAADDPENFVALWGVERTCARTGHINIFMPSTHIFPVELNDFYRAVNEMDLVGHFNHPTLEPEAWYNDYQQFRYSPEGDKVISLVEVRNEGEEACYIEFLKKGWHVGAVGNTDAHSPQWGQVPFWTVALARSLTREDILESLKEMRTYSTASRTLRLEFTVDGEDMGARISRPIGQVDFVVAVADSEEEAEVERIDLFFNGDVKYTIAPQKAGYRWEGQLDIGQGRQYCFVKVTQAEGKVSWSSPIWIYGYDPDPWGMEE